jgi:hypothetical protein
MTHHTLHHSRRSLVCAYWHYFSQLLPHPRYFIVCSIVFAALTSYTAIAQYKTGASAPAAQPKVQAVQNVQTQAAARINADSIYNVAPTIVFSGIRWKIRTTSTQSEPGNNFFSSANSEVWTDSTKKLHLKINTRDRYWFCVELVADTVLGYGTYAIFPEIKLDTLPQNIMLEFGATPDKALHTYIPDDFAIQFTRMGTLNSANTLQYVVSRPENSPERTQERTQERKERIFRPDAPFRMQGAYSTHAFTWRENSLEFASYHDHGLPTPYLATLWEFTGSTALNLQVPKSTTPYRMRLRLWSAGAPVGGKPFEVIIKKVQFVPLKK